ncbi:MAG: hypothetical protein D6701_00380 [Gemmatimonadetes bacterium]|nr:MAG: hypothetical protein D6701_00380 [Gemmatimonadota bacterium]
MKKTITMCALLAGLALAGAQSLRAQDLPEGVTQAMVEQGKQIFAGAGLCAACHGPEGKGMVGPDLTDAEWLHGDGSYTFLVELITKGVSQPKGPTGAIMPPKGGSAITEDQVKAVAAYVWSLSHHGGH